MEHLLKIHLYGKLQIKLLIRKFMKLRTNRTAQVAIEVLVIIGILVIGAIILGITYINGHNKNIAVTGEAIKVQENAITDLKYTGTYNPSPVYCGNNICEVAFGETVASCPQDCEEIIPPIPPVEQNCNFVSAPTFSPVSGSIIALTPESKITISHTSDINCANFRIYYTYTNNGSTPGDPTQTSNRYSAPIPVSSLVSPNDGSSVILKIKAIIYADSNDGSPSNIQSNILNINYTVIIPYCFFSYGTGEGIEESPKIICNLQELNEIKKKLDGYYILEKDLDLSADAFFEAGIEYNPEEGWEPIGSEGDPFTGSFNGNNHKLSNLFINREDYVGFFGYVKDGNISNLYLVSSEIKANNFSGVLAGYSHDSKITNCSTTGNLSGNNYLGGLIGYSLKSNIILSFSKVNIIGNEKAGGLISYSEESQVTDCFSRGNVTAQSDFAGFIGIAEKGGINFSYSTGLVKKETGGDIKDAGFIKKNTDCIIKSSYWDKDTSLQDTSAGGDGKNTEEMKHQETFESWDFGSVWKIGEESINDWYPFLQKNLIIEVN